ncbi:MAG: c-type cytochrome biogenesis protein CcmI [Burkholderiaceae bacterium]
MLFWVSLAIITVAATACVIWPLLFARASSAESAAGEDERRLAVFRDRKREIDADRQAGRLSADEADRALADLTRQLSEEMPAEALARAGASASTAASDAAPDRVSDAAAATRPAPAMAAAAPARRRAWATALLVAIAVPLAALVVYGRLGAPELTDPQALAARPAADAAQIDALAAEIERRVQTHPDEGEAWAMLAEARKLQRRFDESAQAFAEARKRLPPNARLLADYAETLALAAGGDFGGRPVEMLEEALRIDPDEPKAVALMGAAQYRLGNLERAQGYLQRLHAGLTPGSPEAQQIGEVLARVSAELAQRGAPPAAAAGEPASNTRIRGTIRIADALAARVPAGATLFIVAREVDGPRIPVAVARIGGAALPYSFTLDDSQAMDPSRRLSQAGPLTIEARLSAQADATRRAGDLIGQAAPVRPGDGEVTIVIDQVITP